MSPIKQKQYYDIYMLTQDENMNISKEFFPLLLYIHKGGEYVAII